MMWPFSKSYDPVQPPDSVGGDPRRQIWLRVHDRYVKHRHGTKRWSFTYHACFGAVTAIGVLATLISGHPTIAVTGLVSNAQLAGLLTATMTLLTALGGFFGFERKWRANRVTSTRLWLLMIQLEAPDADLKDALTSLQNVLTDHDNGVLGEQGKKH